MLSCLSVDESVSRESGHYFFYSLVNNKIMKVSHFFLFSLKIIKYLLTGTFGKQLYLLRMQAFQKYRAAKISGKLTATRAFVSDFNLRTGILITCCMTCEGGRGKLLKTAYSITTSFMVSRTL